MYRFTIHPKNSLVEKEDFELFHSLYEKCIREKLLSFSEINFITDLSQIQIITGDTPEYTCFKEKLEIAFADENLIQKDDQTLILPFPVMDATIVAFIRGIDPFFLKKTDPVWLMETRDTLLNEFTLIKQANVNIETGLPNLYHLYHVLNSCEEYDNLHLMLIEILPRAGGAHEALLQKRRATLALKNYFNNKVLIHDIGMGVFAIVMNHYEKTSLSRLGTSLISWLRREKFRRVHIGCSYSEDIQPGDDTPREKELVDQAWHALRISGKRGPFSYCDYSLIAHPEKHPLRRPSRKVMAKFQRKWKKSDFFSIVQLKVDRSEDVPLLKILLQGLEQKLLVHDDYDLYLYLEGMKAEEAVIWASNNIKLLKEKYKTSFSISIGVASFPYINFQKAEVVRNCRKALLHAEFFGPGSSVIFDPVSLNISGDIYYGDGDIPHAIKEYRRGLLGEEENINLLNSLGVAYTAIEKQKEAQQCFKKVLQLDDGNFMALYNLGIGEELQGRDKVALSRFEKAVALSDKGDEASSVERDLLFQLGKMYCRTGKYKKCIEILRAWFHEKENETSSGRALRYLGIAYYYGHLNYKEAMKYLQKALQFDEFDAESMGLLGIVYLEFGEGDEIALSLCDKSVELDPQNKLHRLRLAKVQVVCGLLNEAKSNLRKCTGNKKTRTEACFQLGCIYENEGKIKRARLWFSKLLAEKVTDRIIKKHIRKFEEVHA